MIIGITGKSGSGKSYLSEILAKKLNLIHIDIDKISHDVLNLKSTKKFLINEFGTEIFDSNILNRKRLGKIVFSDKNKLDKLNNFCKLEMEKIIDEQIASTNKSLILDYALLCGLKQFEICDIKILLKTNINTRYSRVKNRENITKEYFISRDNSLSEYNENQFDFVFNDISETDTDNLINLLSSKV